jgi:mannose-1-phosphate guanylyltransferase
MINFLLCGGSGTRLWPISRKNFPKQFCKLINDESIYQDTIVRNAAKCSSQMVIANRENVFIASDQLNEVIESTESAKFILEPVGRNTAPAIALGCFAVDPNEIVLVTPTDHMIQGMDKYYHTLAIAEQEAESGYIVTFGIKPTRPETGYGYIECGSTSEEAAKVLSFKEKPDIKTAEKYLELGNFSWNSGMFCFKAGVMLEELKKYTPEIYAKSKKAYENSQFVDGVCKVDYDDMMSIPSDSIDYAVMEKSLLIKAVKTEYRWNDVGCYDALEAELEYDDNNNSAIDNLVTVDSKNNTVISDKLVAMVGVEDLIIVDTIDAMLIAKKNCSQKVKNVVDILNQKGKKDKRVLQLTQIHTTAYRPWGAYTVLEEKAGFKMKRITVKPGRRLSLQKHYHRSEHWIVVSGSALVTKGDKEYFVKPNESIYISMGEEHRVENKGKVDLIFLEIQVGEYLGEDDIVRIDDDYER